MSIKATVENHELKMFLVRIRKMNETFNLPSNRRPTDQGVVRLLKFYKTIIDEVRELLECTDDETLSQHVLEADPFLEETDIEEMVRNCQENGCPQNTNMTAIADTLGDLAVYVFSEARRWGIPLIDVLQIIMDSQDSKLVDGKPVMSPDGSKFIKGPNFEPPEPKIRALIERLTQEPSHETT